MNIDQFLLNLQDKLLHPDNWSSLIMSRQWTNGIPTEAGVYALKEGEKIVYVGETGNLRERMNDLLDSRHHTVRRTIGEKLFSKLEGFEKATTKKKFPKHIEKLVNEHITKNLKMAYLEVPLGRKELEERVQRTLSKDALNKRGKRKKK